MIQVELIRMDRSGAVYGVVDYLSGTRVVRFEGSNWLCLSFITGMSHPNCPKC